MVAWVSVLVAFAFGFVAGFLAAWLALAIYIDRDIRRRRASG